MAGIARSSVKPHLCSLQYVIRLLDCLCPCETTNDVITLLLLLSLRHKQLGFSASLKLLALHERALNSSTCALDSMISDPASVQGAVRGS